MSHTCQAILFPPPDGLVWWCPLCKTGQRHPHNPSVEDSLFCDVCCIHLRVVEWDHDGADTQNRTSINRTKRPLTLHYEKESRVRLLMES